VCVPSEAKVAVGRTVFQFSTNWGYSKWQIMPFPLIQALRFTAHAEQYEEYSVCPGEGSGLQTTVHMPSIRQALLLFLEESDSQLTTNVAKHFTVISHRRDILKQ
jgi:hypothetical protein